MSQRVDNTPEKEKTLADNNGQEGRPVYVEYDGAIYDLSASRVWKGGLHQGRHYAGQDLTEAINEAPHGPEMLTRFPIIVHKVQNPQYNKLIRLHLILARVVNVLILVIVLVSAFFS